MTTKATKTSKDQQQESATPAMYQNALDTLTGINAEYEHVEAQRDAKAQEIANLDETVRQAEEEQARIQGEGAQLTSRLRYARNQHMLAKGTSGEGEAAQTVASLEKEYADLEAELQKALKARDQAQAKREKEAPALQSDLSKLDEKLSSLSSHYSEVKALRDELHAKLGQERMESLRAQIEQAEQARQDHEAAISLLDEQANNARRSIASELADWPRLQQELARSHGEVRENDTSSILAGWVQFVEALREHGTGARKQVGTHHLADYLELNRPTIIAFMDPTAWEHPNNYMLRQRVEIVRQMLNQQRGRA